MPLQAAAMTHVTVDAERDREGWCCGLLVSSSNMYVACRLFSYARREVGVESGEWMETENDGPRLFRKHGNPPESACLD
jgi:hypothetical protein